MKIVRRQNAAVKGLPRLYRVYVTDVDLPPHLMKIKVFTNRARAVLHLAKMVREYSEYEDGGWFVTLEHRPTMSAPWSVENEVSIF